MGAFVGVFLHALGGFASGSFYIPYKQVRNWAWESYWLVGGFFSWIIVPWLVAWLTVPGLMDILTSAPKESLLWSYIMGILWGIGGLTFGLSMRYLGISLGMAIALGYCAAFGTVIPPVWEGKIRELLSQYSGLIILSGVGVCLLGIAVCGWAGIRKEKELSDEDKKATIQEFSFTKGLAVATFSGILSACMAFGLAAGKPIAELAVAQGVAPLWQQGPVLIVILAGGFTTNFLWCVLLNLKNRTGGDYLNTREPHFWRNYLFSAVAGTTWYLQFMFYGMGTSFMGQYDFSSWTLHMAFIIIFSTIWGLYFHEWKGSSRPTRSLVTMGIAVVIASTLLVGYGNYLAGLGK